MARLHRAASLVSDSTFQRPGPPSAANNGAKLWARLPKISMAISIRWPPFALPPTGLREALALSENGTPTADQVWNVCRRQARLRLGDLARRIEPRATWDDLILPCSQKDLLREICAHVRHRPHVYETWGFADRSPPVWA
jgi:hypothetical protein